MKTLQTLWIPIWILLLSLASTSQAAPPNVVLIMSDDQGYGDIAFHGNTKIKTPNLDRLARQSVRLTNFHVDPTCSPTRSALMTGRYSTRAGVWHTIAGRSFLHPDELTMAEIFAASHYATGIFGKWHLGDNYPLRAGYQGFQESLVLGGGGVGQTPDAWGNDYHDDIFMRNGKPQQQTGYCTEVFASAALEFIEANVNRPFFCYLPTNVPHFPYYPPTQESVKEYAAQGVPQPMDHFYAMITHLDQQVGRVLDKLEELGLAENTIVIFMTDNGSAEGVSENKEGWSGHSAGMRGLKGTVYEGGHRVPCFIRFPKRLPKDKEWGGLSAHFDLLPTLIDLCEIKPPVNPAWDGVSLAKQLLDPSPDSKPLSERTLFVHSQRIQNPEKGRNYVVMTDRWRLVNGKELYDIKEDPSHTHNLFSENPDVVQILSREYDGWWDSLRPAMSREVAISIGAEQAPITHLTAHDWRSEQIPAYQDSIKRDPMIQGDWYIEVKKAGEYQIKASVRPGEAAIPMGASKLTWNFVSKDEAVSGEQPLNPDDREATLTIKLPQGSGRFSVNLIDNSGRTRGAYFVTIEPAKP